jgi:hypothetical protein
MVNSEAQWTLGPSGPKVSSAFILKPRYGGCCSSSSLVEEVTGVKSSCSLIHTRVYV